MNEMSMSLLFFIRFRKTYCLLLAETFKNIVLVQDFANCRNDLDDCCWRRKIPSHSSSRQNVIIMCVRDNLGSTLIRESSRRNDPSNFRLERKDCERFDDSSVLCDTYFLRKIDNNSVKEKSWGDLSFPAPNCDSVDYLPKQRSYPQWCDVICVCMCFFLKLHHLSHAWRCKNLINENVISFDIYLFSSKHVGSR